MVSLSLVLFLSGSAARGETAARQAASVNQTVNDFMTSFTYPVLAQATANSDATPAPNPAPLQSRFVNLPHSSTGLLPPFTSSFARKNTCVSSNFSNKLARL